MSKVSFLFDNDVRHLAAMVPAKQAVHLQDLGLAANADDSEIVFAASGERLLIVTNNRRDFQQAVVKRIRESREKDDGCAQVWGLVIVKPSDAISQKRLFAVAAKRLMFEGKRIGWKTVSEECLQVVLESSGAIKISKLPRCPFCPALAEKAIAS
jgi:hypothetical protein